MAGEEKSPDDLIDQAEIRIRFPKAKLQRLQQLGKHYNTNVSQITRILLNKYLDEHAHIVLTLGVALALTPLI